MKNRIALLIVKFGFLFLFCGAVILHMRHQPRIMILHSYATDYSWVKEIDVGVKRVFDKYPEVTLHWHYLDLKSHTDEAFVQTASTDAIHTIERWRPDVLIIFDDIAQKVVGMRYLDRSDLSIVYAGVNGNAADYHYDKARNVTGILERKPARATEETINMLWHASGGNPGKKPRVLLIGDQSPSYAADLRTIELEPEYQWSTVAWQKPVTVSSFDEWKQVVLRAQNDTDVLLMSAYRQLAKIKGEKGFVAPKDVIAWTEANSRIPLLGLTTSTTEDGSAIAIGASGYEQGSVAAEMAMAIVNGTAANKIEPRSSQEYMISMRKSALDRRGIVPPSVYRTFAHALNLFYD